MANKVYQAEETKVVFGSEGGDDVDWSTESIANQAGRRSAVWDRGAAPQSRLYRVRFYCQCQATPTLGRCVYVYMNTGTANATTGHWLNDDGITDGTVSSDDKLQNLYPVGEAKVDQAAANIEFVFETIVEIYERYVQMVLWNETGATLTTDVSECKLELTPIPDEIQ